MLAIAFYIYILTDIDIVMFRERPVRNESYSVQLQFGVKYVHSKEIQSH